MMKKSIIHVLCVSSLGPWISGCPNICDENEALICSGNHAVPFVLDLDQLSPPPQRFFRCRHGSAAAAVAITGGDGYIKHELRPAQPPEFRCLHGFLRPWLITSRSRRWDPPPWSGGGGGGHGRVERRRRRGGETAAEVAAARPPSFLSSVCLPSHRSAAARRPCSIYHCCCHSCRC